MGLLPEDTVNLQNSALLLLDYQIALCFPEGAVGGPSGLAAQVAERGVLGNAARCLSVARKAGAFVCHARVVFDPAYVNRSNRSDRFGAFESSALLRRGDAQTQFCEDVSPIDGELVVEKGCVDPFIGSSLFAALTSRGIRSLYLAGVATNFVVESAARHAGDSGFDVTVIDDCCAAYDEDMHRFSVERVLPVFSTVITSDEYERSLGATDG